MSYPEISACVRHLVLLSPDNSSRSLQDELAPRDLVSYYQQILQACPGLRSIRLEPAEMLEEAVYKEQPMAIREPYRKTFDLIDYVNPSSRITVNTIELVKLTSGEISLHLERLNGFLGLKTLRISDHDPKFGHMCSRNAVTGSWRLKEIQAHLNFLSLEEAYFAAEKLDNCASELVGIGKSFASSIPNVKKLYLSLRFSVDFIYGVTPTFAKIGKSLQSLILESLQLQISVPHVHLCCAISALSFQLVRFRIENITNTPFCHEIFAGGVASPGGFLSWRMLT